MKHTMAACLLLTFILGFLPACGKKARQEKSMEKPQKRIHSAKDATAGEAPKQDKRKTVREDPLSAPAIAVGGIDKEQEEQAILADEKAPAPPGRGIVPADDVVRQRDVPMADTAYRRAGPPADKGRQTVDESIASYTDQEFAFWEGEPSAQDGGTSASTTPDDYLAETKDTSRQALSLPSILSRFGIGMLDYQPRAWRHVSLDKPVYFSNTYIGGNALFTFYRYMLAQFSKQGRPAIPGNAFAHLYSQPYDPPVHGGMALYAHLDTSHVTERSRIFLQVGLKGSERFTWRRPALVMLVLDLMAQDRQPAFQYTRHLAAAMESYDYANLIAPGHMAAEPVTGKELLRRLRQAPIGTADSYMLWQQAVDFFAQLPARYAGNKRLILLVDGPLPEYALSVVHRLQLADINTTVITKGGSSFRQHAQVAAIGQGNLYLLADTAETADMVKRELYDLGRIVARALRLNIQLGKGVKLVQVIGSRPLADQEKQQVKAAEKAVDKKLARTLGIAGDRGKDDPGLQTIIPYFYGRDEHVILLELEVEQNVFVADVRLKYKDMVDMRNRVLYAAVSLSNQPVQRTPRHIQVRRNLFGAAVGIMLAELQGPGAPDAKITRLRRFVTDARRVAGPLDRDGFLKRDVQMLDSILRSLETGESNSQVNHLLLGCADVHKCVTRYRNKP